MNSLRNYPLDAVQSHVFEIIHCNALFYRKHLEHPFSGGLKVYLMFVRRYAEMIDELSQMGKNMPRTELPPLEVAISKKLKAYVEDKYREAGVTEGDFLVFHGIECDSSANMTSTGDTDCLLPLEMWAEIAKSTRCVD